MPVIRELEDAPWLILRRPSCHLIHLEFWLDKGEEPQLPPSPVEEARTHQDAAMISRLKPCMNHRRIWEMWRGSTKCLGLQYLKLPARESRRVDCQASRFNLKG